MAARTRLAGTFVRVAAPYVAFAAIALGIANFIWFMVEVTPKQLVPSLSKVEAGHYLLLSKTHGGYVEVSKAAWDWLRFHEVSIVVTHPMAILGGAFLSRSKQSPPALMRVGMRVLGVVVAVWLLWSGLTWAVPQLGAFGVLWTGGVILIITINAIRYVRRNRLET